MIIDSVWRRLGTLSKLELARISPQPYLAAPEIGPNGHLRESSFG
jgi:hypothetical protein